MIDLNKKPQSAGATLHEMKLIFMQMPGDAAMRLVRKKYEKQDGVSVLYSSWGTEHPTIDQNELRELLGTSRYIKLRELQQYMPV